MSEAQSTLPTADPDEVKWQVALFALMPLILGAMTQPVGRVLDQPSRYQFWMRSSPILCAADMLHFLIRYTSRCSRDWNFLLHYRAELACRFRDDRVAHEPYDVQRTAIVRWMLILLGGAPCQTIKLAAMQGIPLTKALALVFFLSIVFGEVISISASTVVHVATDTEIGHPPEPSQQDNPTPLTRSPASIILAILPATAEAAHIAIVSYTTFALIQHAFFVSIPPEEKLYSVIMISTLSVVFPMMVDYFRFNHEFVAIFAAALLAGLQSFLEASREDPGADLEGSWEVTLGSSLISLLLGVLYWIIGTLIRNTFWLLVYAVHGTRVGGVFGVSGDAREQDMLGLFLWTAVIYVLAYAYLFDGTGTYNPSWTGVFG